MKFNPQQYAIALYEALRDARGKAIDEIITNFVRLLERKHVLSKSSAIIEAFKKYVNQQEDIIAVTAHVARDLTKEEQKDIIAQLEKATKKNIELTVAVDPELIGGLKITYNDTIIDGSLRASLTHLQQSIKS